MRSRVAFCLIAERLIIRDVFRLLDNERSGLIAAETFWRELESNSIVLLKSEKDSLQLKYYETSAPGQQPRLNYKLFERDLVIVSHLYAEMAGMVESKVRNPAQLLETIVKEILTEFNSLEEFARASDSKNNSYLTKGNVKNGFAKYKARIGITDEDFDKQFEELYGLVNPNQKIEPRIYYYKFSENLSKYVTPIILKVGFGDADHRKGAAGLRQEQGWPCAESERNEAGEEGERTAEGHGPA
jgi:hypothetical protein